MATSHRAASTLVESVSQAALLLQCRNDLGISIDGRLARIGQETLDMSASKNRLHGSRGGLAGLLQELRRIVCGRRGRSRARHRGHAGGYRGSGTAECWRLMTMASLPANRQQWFLHHSSDSRQAGLSVRSRREGR